MAAALDKLGKSERIKAIDMANELKGFLQKNGVDPIEGSRELILAEPEREQSGGGRSAIIIAELKAKQNREPKS